MLRLWYDLLWWVAGRRKDDFKKTTSHVLSLRADFLMMPSIRGQAVVHSVHNTIYIRRCGSCFFNRVFMMENILPAGLLADFHREDGIFDKTKTRCFVF